MTAKHMRTCPLEHADIEDAIERLFSTGVTDQRLVIDIIDALTPADVSRREVAFNVRSVANEGLSLLGRAPTKSLLESSAAGTCQPKKESSSQRVSRSFFATTCRQLAAIACYFVAIYTVGLIILAREVGLAAAIPLAAQACAGKSLVAAMIGPWIQRITGTVSP